MIEPSKAERAATVREERWYSDGKMFVNDDSKDNFEKETKQNEKKLTSWKELKVKAPLECTDEEFVDIGGLNICHSKYRLQLALKHFDNKVVALKRRYFQQAMNQIQEVVRFYHKLSAIYFGCFL